MCYKIESSFALIHHLKTNKSCSIKEIVAKKYKIEKNIPSVFVDVSKNSILQTVSVYPEIFIWEDNRIKRKDTADKYFNSPIIDFFNDNIDESIKSEVIKYFELDV